MTQKLIANMLGVHRVDVTNATGKLQKDGLISYHSSINPQEGPRLGALAIHANFDAVALLAVCSTTGICIGRKSLYRAPSHKTQKEKKRPRRMA
jgi:hypothetical protein